jgi:hypothetical protein
MCHHYMYPSAYCAMLCCMYVALVALAKAAESWIIFQKPAKKKFKKFVKLMNNTCTCNDLSSFEHKTHSKETEINVNLLKLA